jgi:hypothetical protein
MANPGKPAEVKRKLGAKGYSKEMPSSVVALPAVSQVPEPLKPLSGSGLDLWDRTWQRGFSWLSANTDIQLLQMVCEQLDERDQLRDYVLLNVEAWHERSALRELEKSIRSNLSLLGFTPTDRMKLGVAEVKVESKMEQLRNRQAQREQVIVVDSVE